MNSSGECTEHSQPKALSYQIILKNDKLLIPDIVQNCLQPKQS